MIELFTFWLAGFCTGVAFTGGVAGWLRHRMGPPKGSYGLPPNHSWRGTRSITFPDPDTGRQPTNPYTGGPVKPEPPTGRVVDIHGRTIGRIPRSQGDTPNPPPTAP